MSTDRYDVVRTSTTTLFRVRGRPRDFIMDVNVDGVCCLGSWPKSPSLRRLDRTEPIKALGDGHAGCVLGGSDGRLGGRLVDRDTLGSLGGDKIPKLSPAVPSVKAPLNCSLTLENNRP
ncbi:hypothetical protein ISCGN_000698, partial [Ixodes scapularis]